MADVENSYTEIPADGVGGPSAANSKRWAKVRVALLGVSSLVLLSVVFASIGAPSNTSDTDPSNLVSTMPSSRFRMSGKPMSPVKTMSNMYGMSPPALMRTATALGYSVLENLPYMSSGLADVARPSASRSVVAHAAAVKKGQSYVVRQPKPLGVKFKQKGDAIVVDKIDDKDADDRIRIGDTLLAVSASFGGEIWPAKSFQQTMMAINTRSGLVYMKLQAGGGARAGGIGGLFNRKVDSEADRIEETNDPEWERQVDSVQAIQNITVVAGLIGLGLLAYIALTIK